MLYSTFYARLVPNGAATGTKFSVSVSGISAVVEATKTWSSGALLFSIKPKSSGQATVTFKNDTTGDIIGTKTIMVRSNTLANPTYDLNVSATSVNEGGTITFSIDTSDVPVGTNIAYAITGVSVADISLGSLTGNFVVSADGSADLPITITNDALSEGTETLTLTLTGKGLSKAVTINDTSLVTTYAVGVYGTTSSSIEITEAYYDVDNAFIFTVGQWYDSANNSYVRGYIAANGTGAIVENNLYIDGIKFNPDQANGNYLDPITGSINYVAYILTGTPGINFSDDFRFKLTNLNNGNTYYSGNGFDVVVVNNQTLLAANSPEHRDIILANLLIVGNNVKLEIERL